jgi:hypothetical protein
VKVIVLLIGLLFLTSCELGRVMMEQPGDRAKRLKVDQPNEQGQPKSSALLEKHTEVFTGKVVLDEGAYRLELVSEPGTLLKLTRARRETEFEKEQILLRKYYEKTITVNGTRKDDWIWGADITGQYVPPGGPTGPNMNAPKQTRP